MAIYKKKITKRTLNAQETKNRLFNTAIMLFSKYGYEHVTIEEITEYAGVSKGAFYTHFKSKDEVLIEQFRKIDDHYEHMLKPLPADAAAPQMLFALIDAMCGYCQDICGINVIKVIYMNQISFSKHADILNNKDRAIYKILEKIVKRARESDDYHFSISDEEMVEFLARSTRAILYDWCLYDGQFDLKQEGYKYFNFINELLAKR